MKESPGKNKQATSGLIFTDFFPFFFLLFFLFPVNTKPCSLKWPPLRIRWFVSHRAADDGCSFQGALAYLGSANRQDSPGWCLWPLWFYWVKVLPVRRNCCFEGAHMDTAVPGCLWMHIPLLVKFLLAGLFPSPCASAHIWEQGSSFPPGLSCGFCHK